MATTRVLPRALLGRGLGRQSEALLIDAVGPQMSLGIWQSFIAGAGSGGGLIAQRSSNSSSSSSSSSGSSTSSDSDASGVGARSAGWLRSFAAAATAHTAGAARHYAAPVSPPQCEA
jgi:hypothetical protein